MRTAWHLITLLVLSLLASYLVPAQSIVASKLWLHAWGEFGAFENLRFGNTEINTFGVDSTAPGEFWEFECPPPSNATRPLARARSPLQGFLCIWILPPGRAGQWGTRIGLCMRDWRHLDGFYEARKDTWAVKFVQNDNSGATISFKWPDAATLAAQCDSLILIDVSGQMGWPANRLDMFSTDTLDVPAAGDRFISVFRMIKTGAKGTLDVQGQEGVPFNLATIENYPNPFNPTTTIEVKIPGRGYVELKAYDILGREVAKIFSGTLEPGTQELTWDARGIPSGVYIARLSTDRGSFTRKLVLTR